MGMLKKGGSIAESTGQVAPSFRIKVGQITRVMSDQVSKAFQDDGGVFTDFTAAANDAAANDVTFFPAAEQVNDAFYFGCDYKFGRIRINIGTSGTVGTCAWEYYNGSAWVALVGTVDGTTQLKAAFGEQTLTHTVQSNWSKTTINTQNKYWIRARVTGVYTVNPLGTQVWLERVYQPYTGVGFQPYAVWFTAFEGSGTVPHMISWGYDDGVSPQGIEDNNFASAGTYLAASNLAIAVKDTSGAEYLGNVSSFDSDGFTMLWSGNNLVNNGTLAVNYLALG